MDLERIERLLLLCAAFNYAVLIVWFGVFAIAHDWLYRLHGRWFTIPASSFDAIHYAGMAVYKIGILLFFLVPFLALRAA